MKKGTYVASLTKSLILLFVSLICDGLVILMYFNLQLYPQLFVFLILVAILIGFLYLILGIRMLFHYIQCFFWGKEESGYVDDIYYKLRDYFGDDGGILDGYSVIIKSNSKIFIKNINKRKKEFKLIKKNTPVKLKVYKNYSILKAIEY